MSSRLARGTLIVVVAAAIGMAAGCGGGEETDRRTSADWPGVWLFDAAPLAPTVRIVTYIWPDDVGVQVQSVDSGETFCQWEIAWTYPEGGYRANGTDLLLQQNVTKAGCGKEVGEEILFIIRTTDSNPATKIKTRAGDVDLDEPDVPETYMYLCSTDMTAASNDCDPDLIKGTPFEDNLFEVEAPAKPTTPAP